MWEAHSYVVGWDDTLDGYCVDLEKLLSLRVFPPPPARPAMSAKKKLSSEQLQLTPKVKRGKVVEDAEILRTIARERQEFETSDGLAGRDTRANGDVD